MYIMSCISCITLVGPWHWRSGFSVRTSEELTLCLRKISELEECASSSDAELQRGDGSWDGRVEPWDFHGIAMENHHL